MLPLLRNWFVIRSESLSFSVMMVLRGSTGRRQTSFPRRRAKRWDRRTLGASPPQSYAIRASMRRRPHEPLPVGRRADAVDALDDRVAAAVGRRRARAPDRDAKRRRGT